MEIIERQGEGKFAIATRSCNTGDLIHVARPLICVPNVGRIRAGSICCGCLKRISIGGNATSSSSLSAKCPACHACYCSSTCESHNSTAHFNSGECEAMKLFSLENKSQKTQETDEETLVMAALIARALIEGYSGFPLEQKQTPPETVVTAIMKTSKQAELKMDASLADEIKFVHNQPRVSIGSLFPEFVASRKENLLLTALPPSSLTIPAPTLLLNEGNSNNNNSNKSKSEQNLMLLEDERNRIAAIEEKVISSPPSFVEFCDLVSNANATAKHQLEYIERLRQRYFSLAKKAGKSPFTIWTRPIDPLFFAHFYSAYASNCFGAFDPKADKKVSAGVYCDASFYNHSCAPNLMRRRQGRFECFYATAPIEAGQTLNIDYGAFDGSDFPSVTIRRNYLLEHYRFWCGCGKCVSESAAEEKELEERKQKKVAAVEKEEEEHQQQRHDDDDVTVEEQQQLMTPTKQQQDVHCDQCSIGGKMRGLHNQLTHQLWGYECRFCFNFIEQFS